MPAGHRTCIECRILTALELARWRCLPPRVIILTQASRDALDRKRSREFGMRCYLGALEGVPIRTGKSDRVYTKCGIAIAVPVRLSARVA